MDQAPTLTSGSSVERGHPWRASVRCRITYQSKFVLTTVLGHMLQSMSSMKHHESTTSLISLMVEPGKRIEITRISGPDGTSKDIRRLQQH